MAMSMQPENSNQNQNSSQKYLFKGVFVESKLWRRVDYDSRTMVLVSLSLEL